MRINLIIILLIFVGCSPRYKIVSKNSKQYKNDKDYEILVLDIDSKIKIEKDSLIGEIIGPHEKFYNPKKEILKGCGYTEIINDLRKNSRELGANIIDVFDLKKPTKLDNCYKIKANLYRSFNQKLIENIHYYNDSRLASKLDKNADYALVHFYRPKMVFGTIVKFDIYMDDKTLITNLSNGKKISYKISNFGTHTFSGINQKDKKKEISIEIKQGQEYYLRCGVDQGRKYGVTQFSLLDNITGFSEFSKVK